MTPRQHAERFAAKFSAGFYDMENPKFIAALEQEFEEAQRPLRGMFPIMDGPAIPWALIAPCERQAVSNHGQTLARLADRGGLDPHEAVAVLTGRPWGDPGVPRGSDALLALQAHVDHFTRGTYFDSPTLGRGKLVRDRVADEIAARGGAEPVLVVPEAELLGALIAKLQEEAVECAEASRSADPRDAVVQEMADVLDVCDEIEKTLVAIGATRIAREVKRARRGGFEKRLFLRFADVEAWKARGGS